MEKIWFSGNWFQTAVFPFFYQGLPVFSINSKRQVACDNIIISMIFDQGIISIIEDPAFLELINIYKGPTGSDRLLWK